MKSVADLIANKEALIKRNKRGKITAAAVAAAGASVIAAAQAQADSVDGFEDITSSVVSFERLGNGQIEFELENGQRFIASEGQYIIDGNEIMVSSELVTVVSGPGLNTTVVAVAVAGAALLVGLLILAANDDDSSSTSTTATTSSTTPTVTVSITSASSGATAGGGSNTAFAVTDVAALTDIDSVDGGTGTDSLSIAAALTNGDSLDFGSLGTTLENLENVEVTVNSAGGVAIDMNSEDTTLVIDANTGTGTITVTDLSAKHGSTDTAALTAKGLADTQILDVSVTGAPVVKFELGLENAGDAGTATVDLDSGTQPTELTITTQGSADNDIGLTAAAVTQLNIKGAADLTITTTAGAGNLAAVTDINAASATGDIEVTVDASVTDVDLGEGSDKLTLTEAPAATATYSGGAGNDTLVLAGFGTNGTIDGFEIVTATAGTVDLDDLSDVDQLQLYGAITVSNVDVGSIDEKVIFDEGSDITLASGTATSLAFEAEANDGSVTIQNDVATLTAISVKQYDAGTVTLNSTNTDKLTITGSKAAVVAGTGAVALTTVDASAADSLTATANAFTGLKDYDGSGGIDSIDVNGIAAGANINGGAGADVLDLGGVTSGTAVVIGGAGADTITLGTTTSDITVQINAGDHAVALAAVTDGALTGTDVETITQFSAGAAEDLIDLTSLGLSGPIIYDNTGTADADAFNNAYNVIDTDTADVVFVDADADGNVRYVFYDNGAGGVGIIDFGGDITALSTVDGVDFDL